MHRIRRSVTNIWLLALLVAIAMNCGGSRHAGPPMSGPVGLLLRGDALPTESALAPGVLCALCLPGDKEIPDIWLECMGQDVAAVDYPRLAAYFQRVGDPHRRVSDSTITLPDLRGVAVEQPLVPGSLVGAMLDGIEGRKAQQIRWFVLAR